MLAKKVGIAHLFVPMSTPLSQGCAHWYKKGVLCPLFWLKGVLIGTKKGVLCPLFGEHF